MLSMVQPLSQTIECTFLSISREILLESLGYVRHTYERIGVGGPCWLHHSFDDAVDDGNVLPNYSKLLTGWEDIQVSKEVRLDEEDQQRCEIQLLLHVLTKLLNLNSLHDESFDLIDPPLTLIKSLLDLPLAGIISQVNPQIDLVSLENLIFSSYNGLHDSQDSFKDKAHIIQ